MSCWTASWLDVRDPEEGKRTRTERLSRWSASDTKITSETTFWNPHHSQWGAQQSIPPWLVDDSQAQVLQTLRGSIDKGGGKWGVIPFDYGVPRHHHTVGGAGVWQLAKMGHHVGHSEGRVRIQRDGRYLKLLIAEAGGVKRLGSRWRWERTEAKIKKRREEWRQRWKRTRENRILRRPGGGENKVREPQELWENITQSHFLNIFLDAKHWSIYKKLKADQIRYGNVSALGGQCHTAWLAG